MIRLGMKLSITSTCVSSELAPRAFNAFQVLATQLIIIGALKGQSDGSVIVVIRGSVSLRIVTASNLQPG